MKRLFGARADATDVPGMELDTVSKYAVNILLDFKPDESPMRPEALEILRRRTQSDLPATSCLPLGIPLAGLLSEPIRIVQSPRLIAILFEADDKHRQLHMDGRSLPQQFEQSARPGQLMRKRARDTL